MFNKNLMKKCIGISIASIAVATLLIGTPIAKANSSRYGSESVECSTTQTNPVQVIEVDFDADDKEVTFEFNQPVTYNNVTVKITDAQGKTVYETVIIEQDPDDLTVRVPKIRRGQTYNYEITGVKGVNATTSQTLTGTFKAVDID